MRDCNEIQEMLSLYIDNCLENHEKAHLMEHLGKCPDCQEELQLLQETVGMFNNLAPDELIPPAGFRRELRSKLEKQQKAAKIGYLDKITKFINKSSFKNWMPLAAAAVLLLVIVPVLTNNLGFMGTKSTREEAKSLDRAPVEDRSARMNINDSAAPEAPEAAPRDAVGDSPQLFKFKMEQEEEISMAAETAAIERKIIKNGHMNIEVDDYKKTTGQIKAMVKEMQGYVVSENTDVYNRERKLLAGNLQLRIPQERFEEALDRVENMGNTNNRAIDSQDVTEEYVDVESRLRSMRLKEERLLTILSKSGSLGDVLAVENELARTRADLEALEGRLKYLNNRTELSTINVSVRETLTPVKQIKTTGLQGVLARTQEAFIKSINSIIIGFGNLIVYLGAYLPFIILAIVALIVLWFAGKKVKKGYIDKK